MDFEKQFENYSTEKLVKIVNNRNDYNPVAIQAAEKELEKRAITSDQISEIQSNIPHQENTNDKANNRLEML